MKTLLKISAVAIAVPLGLAMAVDTAAAGCKPGYVWRDAQDGDGVCVTPADRSEAKQQNANAANNRVAAAVMPGQIRAVPGMFGVRHLAATSFV